MMAFGDESHLFGGKIGELLFEGSFLEVGFFVGPGKEVGDFDLSFFVDEDIGSSYVPYFVVDGVEVLGAGDQGV